MPIYEYKCRDCGEEFEKLLPVRLHSRTVGCPACGDLAEQQISVPHTASWSSDWIFPNLAQEGDGTRKFESREAYDNFLKTEGIVEVGSPQDEHKPSTYQKIVYGPRNVAPMKEVRGSW